MPGATISDKKDPASAFRVICIGRLFRSVLIMKSKWKAPTFMWFYYRRSFLSNTGSFFGIWTACQCLPVMYICLDIE